MASMYAVYHGPRGLRAIAERVHALAAKLAGGLAASSASKSRTKHFFDTLRVELRRCDQREILIRAPSSAGCNLRALGTHADRHLAR